MRQDEHLTSPEAARYLAVTEGSLRSMRSTRRGPPFHRAGRSVYYVRSELDAYVAVFDAAAVVRRSNRIARMQVGAPSPADGSAPK